MKNPTGLKKTSHMMFNTCSRGMHDQEDEINVPRVVFQLRAAQDQILLYIFYIFIVVFIFHSFFSRFVIRY